MYELAEGQPLNERFTLLRLLGKGGMGEAWLVHDGELDERVVAKIVPLDAPGDRVRLLQRECRHARRLVHSNIVPVYEFHRGHRVSFITMAYVAGRDIGAYRGRAPSDIVRAVVPIAEALEYAHRQGVVHRDIKVSNILVDAGGQPRLLDFGIAGILEPPPGELGLSGGGSRYSMSPQQIAGAHPQPSDDIYAFGVLLYELISGRPPFWPDITSERVRFETPAPLTSSFPIPGKLANLAAALLSKEPEARPANMGAVKEALTAVAAEADAPMATAPLGESEIKIKPPPRIDPDRSMAIRPVGSSSSWFRGGRRRARAIPRIGWPTTALFSLLAGLAFMVFFFLPGWVSEGRVGVPGTRLGFAVPAEGETVGGARAEPSFAPVEDLRKQAVLKEQSEKVLDRVLREKSALEARNVSMWGGETYRAALSSLHAGEEELRLRNFTGAVASLESALRQLGAVRAHGTDLMKEQLRKGGEALESGSAAEAARAFEVVMSIEPGHLEAEAGLRRAGVLNEVLSLVAQGEAFERRGDLRRAMAAFKEAVRLDPLSRPAQQALARVDAGITNERFRRAMSEGMAALERADYRAAKEAFERAGAVRPGSRETADALAEAEEGLRLQVITLHHDKARSLEEREEWREAAEEYRAVLELDPTIRFAQLGERRCVARAELSDRLNHHINHRERLSDTQVLDEANSILDSARGLEVVGPRLERQISTLERILAEASTPVRVELISDGWTEVVVYQVGRLGTFTRRGIDLRPGTYTVVGTREGYRDVRLRLIVVAGKAPEPLVVRCEEKI